jgi:uncharacterized protein
MRNERFEWDDLKAAQNWVKHRVSFEEASLALDDPHGLDVRQDYDDEFRSLLIATANGRILAVVYTERGLRIRLISARRATKNEKNDYFTHGA